MKLCDWHFLQHVCVCVKTPRNTVKGFFQQFYSRGPERVGGVSGQRRHPPPPGENVPAFFFENGKRLSQGPHFRRTTTIWSTTSPRWMASLGQFFNVCVNWGLWDNLYLPRTTPDKHVELSSVCVSPPGATSSRLDGPSEKVQVRKPQLMFPNGTREALVPWIKGRTAGPLSHYSQSGTRISELTSHSGVGRLPATYKT